MGGVIGKNKFTFDLWGKIVNLASRMESHGVPGKLHVSEAVYQKLKDEFNFVRWKNNKIKGLGSMTTYILD